MSKVIGRGRYVGHTYPERSGGEEGVLQNHAEYVAGAISTPAATLTFDTPNFTTRTGKVRVTVGMNPLGAGGSAVDNDVVTFKVRQDAAALGSGSPIFQTTMTGTTPATAANLTYEITDLEPGSTHTFGVQAVDSTSNHTMTLAAGGAFVLIEDIL